MLHPKMFPLMGKAGGGRKEGGVRRWEWGEGAMGKRRRSGGREETACCPQESNDPAVATGSPWRQERVVL